MHALARRLAVDHLTLRRDLKLAYKTFEVLDRIRLLETPDELRLSRSNGSLHEFPLQGEIGPQARRVRAHAVIKADVRGSTLITEELRARGLNPASHFSLNFFNPVNALLAEFGAEKLFVEGDAVILALYDYLDQSPRLAVARACRLACRILQVVGRQNLANRQLDLPELELGLGVSYSAREPNFLYDEGRRIMISSAINAADRLSACSGLLRRSGFAPSSPAFRVAVVRDAIGGERAGPGRDLLAYNVNGVKLDEHAFLKLQEELAMQQVRVPEEEVSHSLFFVGVTGEAHGGRHALVVRHAPVVDWYGDGLGPVEPERRHYFELVVDEALVARVCGLAQGGRILT
jgi:class 3 adenylate cyclase